MSLEHEDAVGEMRDGKCEWTSEDDCDNHGNDRMRHCCGISYLHYDEFKYFKYCPYCGREIEVSR